MTTNCTLSKADQLCLTCSIKPDCKPASPACPRRIALKGTHPLSTVDRILQALSNLRQATSSQIATQVEISPATATSTLYYLYKERRIGRQPYHDTDSKVKFLYTVADSVRCTTKGE